MAHSPLILPWQGQSPTIASNAFIAPTASIIGDVVIGEETSIWFGSVLRGDVHSIHIGNRTNIQDGSVVHVSGGSFNTVIGDDVVVGHGCILHGCTVKNGSFIGMGATLLDGVVVESGAMVAAGSLVPPGKQVPRGELWAGTPARKMRDLSSEEIAGFLAHCRHYAELAHHYQSMIAATA